MVGIFTSVKLPPWWAVPVILRRSMSVTDIIWKYRLPQTCYRLKTKNRLPPKQYRRIVLTPNNTAVFWFYRLRQNVPPTPDTAKSTNSQYRQKGTANSRYRPKGTANNGYRRKGTADTGYRPNSTADSGYRPKRYRVRWIPPKKYRLFSSCSLFLVLSGSWVLFR